ncbi:MAG: restriction endonuclease subunit S [Marinobacter sp.]|nr:restriction endonuclease subunit S [Marinobacter sp.]
MSFPSYPEYQDSGMESVGQIPKSWKTASLSKLFQIKAGGDVDAGTFSENQTTDHPFPIYTNANDSKAIYGFTSRAKYGPNCITVSGRGYVGFAAFRDHIFDAIIRLLVLTPTASLNCKFFEYFINEIIDFSEESSAVGQLSTGQIAPYKVAFPAHREQVQIVRFLDHETAKIEALIHEQERLIELLQEKRQAVISHAVTRGLDPDVPMKDSRVEWLGEVPTHWKVMPVKFLLSLVTSGSRGWAEFYSDAGELFFRITNLTRDSIRPKLESIQYVTPPHESEGSRAKIKAGDILVSITADLGSVCAADDSVEGGYVSQHVALARPIEVVCHSDWLAYYILGDAAKEQLTCSPLA